MMSDGYIPQSTDRISAESSGEFSLRNFGVADLLHTRPSWEAMGISKGKLPSTVVTDQHGNEASPYMTMNGLIFEEFSPEFIAQMNQKIMFSPSAKLQALKQIELAYNEVFDDVPQQRSVRHFG